MAELTEEQKAQKRLARFATAPAPVPKVEPPKVVFPDTRENEIMNFRPHDKGVSAAELIRKTGVLDIQKTHGLGSGIYGVVNKGDYRPDLSPRAHEIPTRLTLLRPLVIQDNDRDSDFTRISVWLIQSVENAINTPNKPVQTRDDIMQVVELCRNLNLYAYAPHDEVVPVGPIQLQSAVDRFVAAYTQAEEGDFIVQPINFLLQPLYDGIYNLSKNGNQFNRGSVLYSFTMEHKPRNQKTTGKMYVAEDKRVIFAAGRYKRSKRSKRKKQTRRFYR